MNPHVRVEGLSVPARAVRGVFRGWQHPIPEYWWLEFRQWMQQNAPKTAPLPAITLPEAVAEGTNEGAPPALARHTLTDAFVLNR